jgi:Transcriptional regulator of heat shock gene
LHSGFFVPFSAATVGNSLALLAHPGMLVGIHASSGVVPTDHGCGYYVVTLVAGYASALLVYGSIAP